MSELEEILSNHPLVQAAIAGALSEMYYEKVTFTNKADQDFMQRTDLINMHNNAFATHPSWRVTLGKAGRRWNEIKEPVTSLLVETKPKKLCTISVQLKYKSEL